MAPPTRRQFLHASGSALATATLTVPLATSLTTLSACSSPESDHTSQRASDTDNDQTNAASPFRFGVASGDPLQDRIIFWTALADVNATSVPYRLQLYADPDLQAPIGAPILGSSQLSGAYQIIKIDVNGLTPGTVYYYQFSALGFSSSIGRTRTLPAMADRIRLALATCGDFTRGFWNAYARLAEVRDIDAVVHLGDYIYENGRQDRLRPHTPARRCVAVDDYRARYAAYRSEPELQAVHQQHPMIWVWDDHETVDGLWRDGADPNDHEPSTDGPFSERKAAALTAVLEWLPVRQQDPNNREIIYREFNFGGMVNLIMLDTRRIGRDQQGEGNAPEGSDFFTQTGTFAEPSRHILGAEQEQWFLDRLQNSSSQWRFIGNSVVFSQIKAVAGIEGPGDTSVYANPDQWDGYKPARDRVFDHIEQHGIDNIIFCTGDVHASIAAEVSRDPNNTAVYQPGTGMGAVATEFVTPSISSGGDPEDPDPNDPEDSAENVVINNLGTLLAGSNPHSRYSQIGLNGYMIMDVNADRVQAEYWHVPEVEQPNDNVNNTANFIVNQSVAAITQTDNPATPDRPNAPELVPT